MKYRIVDFDKMHKKAMEKIIKKGTDGLMKAGEYFKTEVKKQVSKDSHDEGDLVRSIATQKVNKNLVEVGTDLLYGLVQEEGRKPGKYPNFDALVGWAGRHGFHNEGKTKKYDDLHYKAKGKVFILARAIAKKGYSGKRTFKKVLERERNNMIQIYKTSFT